MTTKQILKNTFHGTECTTTLDLRKIEHVLGTGQGDELAKARRQARIIWKKLCGIEGCTCGDTFGQRGSRTW
jgi:hypothetical protein